MCKEEGRQRRQICKWNDLGKLFDTQIVTLGDRGTPEQIVETLYDQRGMVLKKASKMTFRNGNIPFLPIIPQTVRSLYDLMAMVRTGGKTGFTYLDPTVVLLFDVVEDAPQGLYYSYDIEDGSSTCDKSPESAEEIFKQQKRFRFTAPEIIALTTHTDVLLQHNVWATGSRCGFVDWAPFIYIDYDGRPALHCFYIDNPSGLWGSPSCGSRQG